MKDNFDSVKSVKRLFFKSEIKTIEGLNKANIEDCSYIFSSFKSGQIDLTKLLTSKETYMSHMFEVSSFGYFYFSGFNTTNVQHMSFMFKGCDGLYNLDLTRIWKEYF